MSRGVIREVQHLAAAVRNGQTVKVKDSVGTVFAPDQWRNRYGRVTIRLLRGRLMPVVELARGWVDWPMQHEGTILYDAPERIDATLKNYVWLVFYILGRAA